MLDLSEAIATLVGEPKKPRWFYLLLWGVLAALCAVLVLTPR